MNPDRAAMISGWKASKADREERDITAPRHDPANRVQKPAAKPRPPPATGANSRPTQNGGSGRGGGGGGGGSTKHYKTQEEQSEEFVAGEDKFVLRQAKKKADIRVRERRAKPIDQLAFNLRWIDEDRDALDDDEDDVVISVPTPEAVVERQSEAPLAQLEADITSFRTLETQPQNLEYWDALLVLCADRRRRIGPQGPEGRSVGSVSADIHKILGPKSIEQLEALEKQIRTKLRSNEPIDTDYWEDLLKSLLVYKAKAKLKRITEAVRVVRVELLKERDPETLSRIVPGLPTPLIARRRAEPGGPESSSSTAVASAPTESASGSASTALVPTTSVNDEASSSNGAAMAPPPGTARFAASSNDDFTQATKAMFEREMARGVGEDEEVFAAEETPVNGPRPHWADKYRPRKPRYFNRVQMGYEWNKYNQTHYDHDNPPPKVVHGYRFNIFYPELIDKSKAPTFKIIREGGRRRGESIAPAGQEDTCLIRFIAGPPYEDIAFRIVDREWDYSAKRERGFRSSFDKGILQLHFQFKKIYYRK